MIEAHDLAAAFGRNLAIVKLQADGLTDAESLLQLPFRGNCLNWVLGHMAVSRDDILAALGEPPLMDVAGACYKRESDSISGPAEGVLPLAELLERLEQAQERIAAALGRLEPADFSREATFVGNPRPLGKLLFFLYFHESYHVGQTEIFRQLAGKDDKII